MLEDGRDDPVAEDSAAIDPPNNAPEAASLSGDSEPAIDPPNNLDGAIDPPNN